ncbi:MAG TPA: diacylglycerol kinase family protein [Patescibacteria group bacterium]|nr:diacylglycerol kinase family protein [Patescibacteria group bacterium]
MYYYIVDSCGLSQRQYEKVQHELHSCISDYHISGEIVRITGIRTVRQLVETAFFHQAKTIVAAGSDRTLDDVINSVGERPVSVGYIPLVKSELAQGLGLPDVAGACKALALRRVEELDLAKANGKNFLTKLSFGFLPNRETFEVQIQSPGLRVQSSDVLGGTIVNCQTQAHEGLGLPTDGLLDVVLVPRLSRWEEFRHRGELQSGQLEHIPGATVLHLRSLEITAPANMPILTGGIEFGTTPLQVEVKSNAVKMIVGRTRTF